MWSWMKSPWRGTTPKKEDEEPPLPASVDFSDLKEESVEATAEKNAATAEKTETAPAPAVDEGAEKRKSLWQMLRGLIGIDISQTVSLPIWLFEDFSYLQRVCEMCSENSTLLDKASEQGTSWERMAYVISFSASAYYASERYDKPFNPVIGETFEYINPVNNSHFLAEQVSHKPPVTVGNLHNDNFELHQVGCVNLRFLGNSVDLNSTGSKSRVILKKTGDDIVYTFPRSCIHNVIVGRVWVDHFGQCDFKNLKTGDSCEVRWKKCGLFSSGRYEVEGVILDSEGNKRIRVFGKWQTSMSYQWLCDYGEHKKGDTVLVWTSHDQRIGSHKVPPFANLLNAMDEEYKKVLPASDSRFRPDRKYLEVEDSNRASFFKLKVEERQRAQENKRKAANQEWKPRWFAFKEDAVPPEVMEPGMWVFNGGYWKAREEKKAQLQEGKEPTDVLEPGNAGTASDFQHLEAQFIASAPTSAPPPK